MKTPVKFKNSKIGYKSYCSSKCVGKDPLIKKKEETNIIKFGTKHASLNKDVKEKVKDIYHNRTDIQKKTILDKRIDTVLSRYGVDNVTKLESIIRS